MKRFFFQVMVLCFLLLPGSEAAAQVVRKTKITPAELKEMETATVAENDFAKISAAEKARVKNEAQALAAYVLKAMLFRIDPVLYPMDAAPGSVEKIALDAIDQLSPSTMTKAKARTLVMWGDPHKKTRLLGKFAELDFKKKTLAPDIKRIGQIEFKPKLRVSNPGAMVNDEQLSIQVLGTSGPSGNYDRDHIPAFNKLDLVLRKVHCVDETNPEGGDDDMVVGGLLIGASGNTNSANSFASGHYDDGDITDHGAYPFGTYSLNSTPGYPKVFYCVLQLIEVDTDEAEAAQALTDVMTLVGTMVSTVNPVIGAIVVAVAQAVEIFTGWLIDDDPFYPYGVTLNLNSSNKFGADGRSENWRTGNISDHGGTYRVGFYWQLKN